MLGGALPRGDAAVPRVRAAAARAAPVRRARGAVHRALDLVLEHFFQRTTITAPDDGHSPYRTVGEYRHMGQHLVITKLVTFRGLNDAIERHYPAKARIFKDH